MSEYSLKFMKKGERGYWHVSIHSNDIDEATEEATRILSKENYKRAKLYKIVYSERTIKEWKDE